MGNQQATDFELGWLAGIIDGEGWLGMSISNDRRARSGNQQRLLVVKTELKITNCDEEICDKAADIILRLGVNPYRRSHKSLGENRRIVHEVAFKHMTGMEKVLPVILPHLIGIKRARAELILQFIELRRTNPGIPNPAYAGHPEQTGSGRHGARTIRPYTAQELALVSTCRALQSLGASETTRETREKAVKALYRDHASLAG